MWGRIRCQCGRYMRIVGYSLATYHSGGCTEYRCTRCGAVAYIWSKAGVDDEFNSAAWYKNEKDENDNKYLPLVWDEEAYEWRVLQPKKRLNNLLTGKKR